MNINFAQQPAFQKAIQNGDEFRKKANTDLRCPTERERGQTLVTWVKDGGDVREEASNIITADKIIARNPTPNYDPDSLYQLFNPEALYNQWLIDKPEAEEIYGREAINSLTTEFSAHQSQRVITAIELTAELMEALGEQGDYLEFPVAWSEEPMRAKIGDWLTDQGYSIGMIEMAKTYERQEKETKASTPKKKVTLGMK